jgi:sulfoxide reductase heme-binding subunit YedZ
MRAGKNNFDEVWVYAFVLGSLLAYRLWRWQNKINAKTQIKH